MFRVYNKYSWCLYDSSSLCPLAYQDSFAVDDRNTKASQSLRSLQPKIKPEMDPSKGFDDFHEAGILRGEAVAPATFN